MEVDPQSSWKLTAENGRSVAMRTFPRSRRSILAKELLGSNCGARLLKCSHRKMSHGHIADHGQVSIAAHLLLLAYAF